MKILAIFILLLSMLHADKKGADDEELRLMYDSFLYTKDLPHAYQLAKKALKRYPNSLLWHQRVADVALWSGKNNESMQHYIYLYQHNDDPTLAKKIIKQMLASYQYKKALPIITKEFRKSQVKSKNSLQNIINIYDKVGKPEEAIKLLKKEFLKTPNAKTLSYILNLQIETGDIAGATKSVGALKSYHDSSPQTALALSKYYFLKKDLQKAYQALLVAKKTPDTTFSPYFERLSDFAAYMHDEESALYAAMVLYHSDKARVIDLDRIQKISDQTDTSLLQAVSKQALKKYKKQSMFIQYINQALEKEKYPLLDKLIQESIQDKESYEILRENPRFWLVKATLDEHFKRTKQTEEDLRFALEKAQDNSTITKDVLWFLINHNYYQALKNLTNKIEKQKEIAPILYHPLAASYLTLHQIDKALKAFEHAYKQQPKDISLQFLYAEILAATGEEKKKEKILSLIFEHLKKRVHEDPKLLHNPKFLREYIQASLPFMPSTQALSIIQRHKKDLDRQDYIELQMLLALKEKSSTKIEKLYHHYKRKDPFIELELAQLKKDRPKQKALMQKLSLASPHFLKIELLESEDKIKEAIAYAKTILQDNQHVKGLHEKIAQLEKEYTPQVSISLHHGALGRVEYQAVKLKAFYYLAKGYGIFTKIEEHHYTRKQKTPLNFHKQNNRHVAIGVTKHIDKGKVTAALHYQEGRKSSLGASVKVDYQPDAKSQLQASVQKQVPIEAQSDLLTIAGTKDTVALQGSYQVAPEDRLTLAVEGINYHDSNHLLLGRGIRTDLTWDHTFKKVPLLGSRLMYKGGIYHRKNRSVMMQRLLKKSQQDERILPLNYQNIGLGVYYGDPDKGYGQAWHPYIDASIFYASTEKKIYAEMLAGMAGSLSKKDMVNLSLFYQDSVNGRVYKNYGVNLSYKQRFNEE